MAEAAFAAEERALTQKLLPLASDLVTEIVAACTNPSHWLIGVRGPMITKKYQKISFNIRI